MTETEFYRAIIGEGVYSVFNNLRESLFYQLAINSRIPISYKKLDSVLSDDSYLTLKQKGFIKDCFTEGSRFRQYTAIMDDICIRYFVNTNDGRAITDEVALHMQDYLKPPVNKIDIVSSIVLFENHPFSVVENYRYPKVIKHEIAHVAIESVIHEHPDLEQFYFSEDNAEFIEFVCDIMQYLSNPSKKENGITKFIEDSVDCFGYDAAIDKVEYLKVVESNITIMVETETVDDEPKE